MSRPVLFRVTNNLRIGGVQKRLRALLPLLTRDYQVHVVTYKDTGVLWEELLNLGVHAHFIPRRGTWDPVAFLAMVRLFRRCNARIVHTHSYGANVSAIPAAALARVSVRVAQVHLADLHWPAQSPLHRRKQILEETLVHRLFTHQVLCVSRQAHDHFQRATGLPDRLLSVLHNGIDLPEALPLSRSQARQRLGLDPGRRWIGFVGRVARGKGLDYFLDFAGRVLAGGRDLGFMVVGGGMALDKYQAKAARLGISEGLAFLGEQRDMAACYAAMDGLVFFSEPWAEGMPGVVLEAAWFGLPILARESATLREIRDHYPGITFLDEKGDPRKELLQAMDRPPTDTSDLRRTFGLTAMHRATLDLYARLLAR